MQLRGKKFSILGDSISTYQGYSDNTEYNSTIGNNKTAYRPNTMQVEETWWYPFIQKEGMLLCVNNSFSGACVGPSAQDGANTYMDRCVHLENDRLGREPDVIFVFIGANDYKNGDYQIGKSIQGRMQEGTFCSFYCEMIAKIREKFPAAEIYLMSILPNKFTARTRQDADGAILSQYNAAIQKVSDLFAVNYIDLQQGGGITFQNCEGYYLDRLHPNVEGMKKIYTAVSDFIMKRK